ADRPGDAELLGRRARCRGARLPRPRGTAADAGMGNHAGQCTRVHPARLVGGDVSRPRHPDPGVVDQSGRRRAARRPRSQVEEVLMALLEIKNLVVEFETASGAFRAVNGVSLSVDEREVLAIVGESGSGKSVSMLAVMGLLPWTATVKADKM